jgi:hypothetical protein
MAGSISNQRPRRPAGVPIRVVLIQPFWSKTALVDRMLGTPADADDSRTGDADVDTAADRAHAARGRHPPFNVNVFVLLRKTP